MSGETPLMEQYHRIKAEHEDEILLFRMGDFYEMFCEDARIGAQVLGLTLTSRNNGAAGRVPLAGVPVKAVDGYIAKLVRAGYKVAVCEQVEDPKKAKTIVKRAVTEVLTPGTVLSENLLESRQNNYLAAIHPAGKEQVALSWLDLSTGEFYLGGTSLDYLEDELCRISPREILLAGAGGLAEKPRRPGDLPLYDALGPSPDKTYHLTFLDDWRFDRVSCRKSLLKHFEVASFNGFGIDDRHQSLTPAGAILDYVARMQPAGVAHMRKLTPYVAESVMVIDRTTADNLELIYNFSGGSTGTLLEVLDSTRTAMGARTMRRWLLEPLLDLERIAGRHDIVQALTEDGKLRRAVREQLEDVSDIQRLTSRTSSQRANPRDVAALGRSLAAIPTIKALLAGSDSEVLVRLGEGIAEFPDLVKLIGEALADEPPAQLSVGGVIAGGYNAELDELRGLVAQGKDWIARYETSERGRSGIGNLKVKFNKVFGYFIEVTKSNLHLVPEDYTRKQTISTGERYITGELKEYEDKVLGAEEKIESLEYELFCALREHLAGFGAPLIEAAAALGELDALADLAETAVEHNYVRPVMTDGHRIGIRDGRHPVVERMVLEKSFVPNDIVLDNEDEQIVVLTGPNMAGKSTVLRQVGLIVLMAHMGGFVPAAEAEICLTDRIFTRVGASDNLARGQSTFMVEMNETANILNNATPRSLVLLDEIGRGTSTFDGLSIAWAVTEFLHEHERCRAKTVFATHYHELTELEMLLPRVRNYNVLVKEHGERIIFLHKIERGSSDRSYGIQVARLAGIPREVITRAREVLANLESGEFTAENLP
ncbi:MAG: DNA mismatch repair protein MutS, partial [Candidatus Glassbacteria bacterium]|nr:DNA mismatch repair protein MutS [Candidatus Glassbacteria bacterium]